MLSLLRELSHQKHIRPLDFQFARFIHELDNSPLVTLAAALVSNELGQGHICVDLSRLNSDQLFGQPSANSQALIQTSGSAPEQWSKLLKQSSCISDGSQPAPLVLEDNKLYLYRYWQHECLVAHYLNRAQTLSVDLTAARSILDRLFQRNYAMLFEALDSEMSPDVMKEQLIKWLDVEVTESIDWNQCHNIVQNAQSDKDLEPLDQLIPQQACLNWQKVAAGVAATQPFSVISGGPGTGKTTTVTRLLAMLVELGMSEGRVPDIRLVAPTGKASARLTESIGGALTGLNCSDDVRNQIPTQAGTIHRLLGVIPGQPSFRHNASNPLHLDILVVDEASMVDLSLMRQLLEALPDHARVILLGDRDQLASVDAGSVLGDICSAADGGYTQSQQTTLEQLTGFDLSSYTSSDTVPVRNRFCLLRKSYRFDAYSGIGTLAKAVNLGSLEAVNQAWKKGFDDIRLHSINDAGYQDMLSLCKQGYTGYLQAIRDGLDDRSILKAFNRFRLLCALREGPYGVEGLNEAIRKKLATSNLIPSEGLWYAGRPVLITQNAHGLGLYNGDIGITLKDASGKLKVVFELPDGTLKPLLPSRLPEHETVFAMTIHKSQGSEFHHTAMILPDRMNPVLTRELTYTGITRARSELDIFASPIILSASIKNQTERASGLQERLLQH